MLGAASLRKIDEIWQFTSEAALEDFVWDNLLELLDLTPLQRQYISSGEICDILAVDKQQGLVILELKNAQDRYVVQQLTRYYHNLVSERAFAATIDYDRPIRLIALAPSFHKHNLIDRQHLNLAIDFLQISILHSGGEFSLQLQDIDTHQSYSLPIPYREPELNDIAVGISPPPSLLLDLIGALTAVEQLAIIEMRAKILGFDPNIAEKMGGKNTIKYGRGKSRPVAEIYFRRKTSRPIVFLWLPIPHPLLLPNRKLAIGRMRLWSDELGVTHVGHVPEGLGKMKLQTEWEDLPIGKRPRILSGYSSQSMTPVQAGVYRNLVQTPGCLGDLTDLALSAWSARA